MNNPQHDSSDKVEANSSPVTDSQRTSSEVSGLDSSLVAEKLAQQLPQDNDANVSANALTMRNLGKRYGKRWVVKDVSFSVEPGQVVGLLGPNGAGKTTSFYMVVGLVTMDKGVVRLGGQDLSKYAMHERARAGIGYLPQEASIFRKLSVEDNIMAILQTRKDLDTAAQKQQLESLISDFSLGHVRHSLGMSVSGGERRRCEIARALAADPKFILLDEPFAGVDPISVSDIKEVIIKLRDRGIGVLITDHNVRETLAICDHAYIVSEGAIIAHGTSREILSNELVQEVYLGKDFQPLC